jgi:endonuclease/exonuclease/phosphatase family metal-dependent hydrolase
LQKLDWNDDNLELFLPCRIDEKFNLLAVWTKQSSSRRLRYIGQLWHYIQQNRQAMATQSLVICGDFNSNSIWDMKHVGCDHTSVVQGLTAIDMLSLYHLRFGEEQGKESTSTFYLHRNKEKSYHIDYAFVSRKLISETGEVVIGDYEYWLTHSDHMPVIFDINV